MGKLFVFVKMVFIGDSCWSINITLAIII